MATAGEAEDHQRRKGEPAERGAEAPPDSVRLSELVANRLQLGEPLAAAGAAEEDRERVANKLGVAIDRFRRCEHVKYEPKGMHEFIVESREPSTEHRPTRNMFDSWLRRPGGSPADVALKTRLKGLLDGAKSSLARQSALQNVNH
jgi:hypothetical protein